jgi:hypothetical protein
MSKYLLPLIKYFIQLIFYGSLYLHFIKQQLIFTQKMYLKIKEEKDFYFLANTEII